jgi:hypothetical protein
MYTNVEICHVTKFMTQREYNLIQGIVPHPKNIAKPNSQVLSEKHKSHENTMV